MKHLILSLFLASGLWFSASAQEPRATQRSEKIEALYVAFMSRELSLTEDEAQKFWPIHAQYDKEIRDVKLDGSELDRQQTVLNIKKKYQDRFAKIIGTDRTNQFYLKDAEFRKKLVERLRKMRQNNASYLQKKRSVPELN